MIIENQAKEVKKKNIKRRNLKESIRLLIQDLSHKRKENNLINESAHVLIRNLRKEGKDHILLRHLDQGRKILRTKNHLNMIDQKRGYIHHHLHKIIKGIKTKILNDINMVNQLHLNLQVR